MMLERLNRGDASRMRPDLEAAIEYLPGLASLALWCRFADTDEDAVAFTDGSMIYAGAGYEKFEAKERRFISCTRFCTSLSATRSVSPNSKDATPQILTRNF
jgi:hypothetical protein